MPGPLSRLVIAAGCRI